MTQEAVQDALVAHLASVLSGVTVTTSLEDAVQRYDAAGSWVLVTQGPHVPNRFQSEDNWTFMVQMSRSLQAGAQSDTVSSNDADRALIVNVLAAVNDDAGFTALMTAGLFDPELKGTGDDQQNEHVFTCSTY